MKVKTAELAAALGISQQAVRKRAKKEQWRAVSRERIGGNVYLFADLPLSRAETFKVQAHLVTKDPVITTPPATCTDNLPADLPVVEASPVSLPAPAIVLNDEEMREAGLKSNLLRLYNMALMSAPWGEKVKARDEFMIAYNSGLAYPHLYKELGPLSWKTLESWNAKVKRNNNDCFRLADRRGRHLRGTCSLTPEQTDIILRCALRPNKPPIAEAVRMAHAVMKQRGIPNGHSEATYRRWINNWKDHNYHVWVFVREGKKAWTDECAFYIERDYDAIEVGDVIIADGHNLNFEIINPWTGKRQNHMTLVLFYDMKSNMPLGWEIMPTENTAAISSALRRAVIRLGKYPRVVYLDNGRAFKARFFSGSQDFDEAGYAGLYKRLGGCQTIYAWPYHGQSKTIERFFGTFAELERLNALSYTGNSIENKPPRMMRGEKLHRKLHEKQFGDRCLTLTEAHQAVAAWFDIYAAREQQKGHLKGIRPVDVFVDGRGPGVNRAELTWLMMSIEVKTIHRNGITFQGQNYYHPALYGRRHPVTVRYDLQDTSSLWIFGQDGELLCEATPTEKVHPAAAQLGTEEDKIQLRRHIEHKRSQEKAATATAIDLLQNIVLPEHDRQMRMIGVDDSAALPAAEQQPARPKVLDFDFEKAKREAAESIRLQQEAEARDFREALYKLDESDRYERLIELSAQGVTLDQDFTGFMTIFEQTPAYKLHKEYWETCEMKYGLMHRSTDKAAGANKGFKL